MNWYYIEIEKCTFIYNKGLYAGAIFSPSIYIKFTENIYNNNSAIWNNNDYVQPAYMLI